MRPLRTLATLALAAPLLACGGGDDAQAGAASAEADAADAPEGTYVRMAADSGRATALASDPRELSESEVEAGRMDQGWKRYVELDDSAASSGSSGSGASLPDSLRDAWDDISARTVNAPVRSFPVHGDVSGPAVARIQILLDQARFSPGVIDGRWGKNTEKAVYWFQRSNGMEATGRVDEATLQALEEAAGGSPVTEHTLTEADVSGPFQDLPEDVYERADQPCLCYESLREQLGEVFHATPELLEKLNPDVALGSVQAGQTLQVPAVEPFRLGEMPDGRYTGGGRVARIVISDGGHYLHAMDGSGTILYHFPSTLGADYAPSPSGDFSVTSVTFDPTWHYKPDLLSRVDPSKEDAVLPEGPNNAVGVVWMQLSKDHYGIHGTSAPSTIGYATSHGCVRLTNWDAAALGQRIDEGVPVEFRDVSGR